MRPAGLACLDLEATEKEALPLRRDDFTGHWRREADLGICCKVAS